MSSAIAIEGLSKSYQVDLGAERGAHGYRTLRDELVHWMRAPLRWRRSGERKAETFWALKNVGFSIEPGEVVGVIGRNGAGKSTLLKVLSRITKPTAGRVQLKGRVGSLLEVGTGFHPELTGRENVFLNGAILGMGRTEIQNKFDEIVEFAEVSRFLDTPVKRYSSGMYVRLAFAVAASLRPEILIVDEVLAVGDTSFQRKCMSRMREVGRSGCTVLFVSHNMPAIESLCTRAVLLEGGKLIRDGGVRELVTEYHKRVMAGEGSAPLDLAKVEAPGRKIKVFRAATLIDEANEPTNHLALGERFRLRLSLDPGAIIIHDPVITIGVDDTLGHRLLSLCTHVTKPIATSFDAPCTIECVVERFPLAPGEYWIKLGLSAVGEELDQVERAFSITVLDGDAFGEGRGIHQGVCVAPTEWRLDR